MEQLAARRAHNPEVVGSNPAPATKTTILIVVYNYGEVAQLARAFGSYPKCRRFKSYFRYHIWPGGQAVKTPPFHGGNTGSSPVGVILKSILRIFVRYFFYCIVKRFVFIFRKRVNL